MLELDFAAGTPSEARWLRDGQTLGPAIHLDGALLRRLDVIRGAFAQPFDRKTVPLVDPDEVRAHGRALYDVFFRPVESYLPGPAEPGPHTLLIRSADPKAFNLPWELVELPGRNLPVGCDAAWAVLRVPGASAGVPVPPPDPGPLRLLFLAAAPDGDVPLDFEREEEVMLRATERLDKSVVVLPFAETGGIDELARLVAEHRPHVVHLSGHGIVSEQGVGYFVFENEHGRSDAQPADQIAARVFRGAAVRCVVLNACQTGLAAATGLADHLVSTGVPVVLGWGASVGDDVSTQFMSSFYQFLASGNSVPLATAKARHVIWESGRRDHAGHTLWDLTFALPRLFALGADCALVNRSAPPQPYAGPKTEPVLLGDDIKGLREGFVGRRKDQQQLIPPLRDGTFSVLVLTGIGGMGKSTLATRAASRLREAGFDVYGVKSTAGSTPAEAGRMFLFEKLLPTLARPFMKADGDTYKAIRNGEYPVEDRVALAVDEWKKRKLALVIDNFEDVLDPDRTIADPGLRSAYRMLTRDLTGGSRLVVTCRYVPLDTPNPESTPHVRIWAVPELKPFELRKFLRRDEKVEGRLRAGDISEPLIERLHRVFGGTPGFLVQVRAWLGTGDLSDWEDEIPDDTPLEEKRRRYCEDLMLPRLYERLPEAGRALVSRLALSELPLPADGLAQLADGADPAAIESAVEYGLAQQFTESGRPPLYAVPGLIRNWLAGEDRLSSADRREVDAALARFWKASYEKDRAAELRVAVDIELLACRTHAARARLGDELRWATSLMGRRLSARAEWKASRALLEELPHAERDGSIWHSLASIDLNEGSYPAAREKFAMSLTMFQAIGDKAGEAATWHSLSTIDLREGSYASARVTLARSLAIVQAIGDKVGEAATWHSLASIDVFEGSYPTARETLAKSLAIVQAIGDKVGEAATWHSLARINLNEGYYLAAREKFTTSLTMFQAIGDKAGEATTWHQLATIDLNEGIYPAAREKFAKSLGIMQAIGARAGEATAWHQLATIDLNEGIYLAAREKFTTSLAIKQAIGDKAGEAATWNQLGFIAWKTDRKSEAPKLFAVSFLLIQAVGNSETKLAWENLSGICSELGYSQEQFVEMVQAVVASYQQDRGASLLAAAFPPET